MEEGCDCAAGGYETFSSVPLTVDALSVESVEGPVAADISDTKDNQAIIFYCDRSTHVFTHVMMIRVTYYVHLHYCKTFIASYKGV